MASALSRQRLAKNLGIHRRCGVYLLQQTVLLFELFQSLHARGIYPAVLRSPIVKIGVAETVLAA